MLEPAIQARHFTEISCSGAEASVASLFYQGRVVADGHGQMTVIGKFVMFLVAIMLSVGFQVINQRGFHP
jgi:hypothetical protein